ncbi:MAG: heavy metal-responsive transcriptional regulator [Deltaproteobacteria bacterium]|nr:heavy metal-responsive transcriptional regulator [Deltaproteobacteria bacterium]
MQLYTIGQIAKEAKVNIQTLRYYERRRLLSPKARKFSGYRVYDEDSLKRLRFIKNAQELGFLLQEISALLNLKVSSKARCGDVQKKAQEKLMAVETKIKRLEGIRKALLDLIKTCHKEETTDHCPILKSLEEEKSSLEIQGECPSCKPRRGKKI